MAKRQREYYYGKSFLNTPKEYRIDYGKTESVAPSARKNIIQAGSVRSVSAGSVRPAPSLFIKFVIRIISAFTVIMQRIKGWIHSLGSSLRSS